MKDQMLNTQKNEFAMHSTSILKLSIKKILQQCPDYNLGKTQLMIEELKRRLSFQEFHKFMESITRK